MSPLIDLPPPAKASALRPTTLTINSGAHIAVTGVSGSGKSTLLNLITGIDRPSEGSVRIDGIYSLDGWPVRLAGVVREFGVMKAIGASRRALFLLIAAE